MVIIQTPLVLIIRDTTLCDKVCQSLTTGWWFSSCTLVSSTNKTERHNINEILLNAVLNTILLSLPLLDERQYKIKKTLLTLVLSNLLRFTTSDYPFGIFKIPLSPCYCICEKRKNKTNTRTHSKDISYMFMYIP